MRIAPVAPASVFLACLGYFLLFRHYGFQIEFEGALLAQLARVARGQVPYVDFDTLYAPGFYYLFGGALTALGGTAAGVRLVLAVLNALSAALLFVLARRVAGTLPALLAPIAWVGLMPLYAGAFASFNVPYAAWPAALACLLVAFSLVAWSDRGGSWRIATVGLWAAVAFSCKPNAGAFALIAATWTLPIHASRGSAQTRLILSAAGLLMAVGAWFAFAFDWSSLKALVHLAPIPVLLTLLHGPLYGRFAREVHGPPATALTVLWGSFAGATLLWAIPMAYTMGVPALLRAVLFIDSDLARVYDVPYPLPGRDALLVGGGMLGAALGAILITRAVVPVVIAGALVGIACVLTAVLRPPLMPEGPTAALTHAIEEASFWIVPLVHWGGLCVLARTRHREDGGSIERPLAVLLPLAIAMFWQMHPRADFHHLIFAAPVTIVIGVLLLEHVMRRYAALAGTHARPAYVALAVTVVVASAGLLTMRAAPAIAAAVACSSTAIPPVDTPRLRVCVEDTAADDLATFGSVVRYLRRHARAGEDAFAFPALAGALFAADLASPVRHDYWFPGHPDHRAEEDAIGRLQRARPRFIVTTSGDFNLFHDAPRYYENLRRFVVERYRRVARFGRFDVLGRRDLLDDLEQPDVEVPVGPPEALLRPIQAQRRQAARRWITGLEVAEAAHARLPADDAQAILMLRALTEGGDLRATGWLLDGYRRSHPRVRREAVVAMGVLRAEFDATRAGWANDVPIDGFRPYLEPYRREAESLRHRGGDVSAFTETVLQVIGRPDG